VVATKSGRSLTGLLVGKTDTEVILRDAQDKEHRIPLKEVDQMALQKQSFMPELLLRDLTAEQAADLLAFLESLKSGAAAVLGRSRIDPSSGRPANFAKPFAFLPGERL
jgi:hypothetical protein